MALAIVDGRFLPLDSLRIAPNNSTKQVQTIGTDKMKLRIGDASIELNMRTRRQPLIRDKYPKTIYLRTDDEKIIIENASLDESGYVLNDVGGSVYEMKFKALSYTVKKATESLL